MDITTVSVVAFVVLVFLFLKFYIPHSNTKQQLAPRLPPGPRQLPLIGSLHHFLLSRFRDHPHKVMAELSTKYGPLILLHLGTIPTVVVSSAEAAKEALKIYDLSFCNRPVTVTGDILSCGGQDIALCQYNDRWRELRKICMLEIFSQRRVLQFRHVREDEVACLVKTITSECRSGQPINLTDKIFCMINDIVGRTAIGGRCKKYRDELLHELDNVVRLLSEFTLVNLYPTSKLIQWFSTSARDVDKCQKRIHHIIGCIIQERATTAADEQVDDLLGVLLRLQKDGGTKFAITNETITAVIFDIFLAGTDTSSLTLQWAISELIKNPRVLRKAQSEVRDIFEGQLMLSEDNMVKLSYMHMVIKETLRLHPPGALIPRQCRETCRIMGYDVPKSSAVAVNLWAIGRDKTIWDTPEEFRPERFENSSIDFKGNDFQFIPFGAGRRICPGMAFGIANVELPLASLLYHFDWKLPAGVNTEDLDMTEAFGLTARRKSKLLLQAKPHISSLHNPN